MKPHIHYKLINIEQGDGFASLIQQAQNFQKKSWELMKNAPAPASKEQDGLLRLMLEFQAPTCERCGEVLPPVSTWGTDRCLVLDSLMGLNEMAMGMVAGSAVATSQPQFYAAQRAELSFIDAFIRATSAHSIMTAHVSKLQDEIKGLVITTSAIGNALGVTIPAKFSEVWLTHREGDKFYWDMAQGENGKAITKSRLFSIKEQTRKVPQDYGPVIDRWRKLNTQRGLKILTQGDSGTGKSYAIGSLFKAGIEVFVLMTEDSSGTYHHFD